jgi:hypothetical protein
MRLPIQTVDEKGGSKADANNNWFARLALAAYGRANGQINENVIGSAGTGPICGNEVSA